MNPLTPEQKKELNVWAIKRDTLLRRIGILTTQNEEKEKKSNELSSSITDLQTRKNQLEGNIEELEKKDKERATLISKEIVELEKRKATLVAEIPTIKKEISGLTSEKNILIEIIANLTKTHQAVLDRVGGLDKIVESVSRFSSENISEFKTFFEELKKTVIDITSNNKKIISETEVMIARVPKILREVTTPVRVIRPVLNKKRLAAKGDISGI